MQKTVKVAVGVVLRGGEVFLCKRAEHVHQGGLWEFPGGKVESDENVTDALVRELAEEIGIQVTQSEPLITINHDYGDKRVSLYVQIVNDFTGEPFGREGQDNQWRTANQLDSADFPAANVAIIEALKKYLTG